MTSTANDQTGKQGEQLAAAYLQSKGYTIISTNWHCSRGEIDIIAQQQTEWVFVEVRTRHSQTTETAFASIQLTKRSRLITAIYAYLKEHKLENVQWRVDVIAVALPRNHEPVIDHVEDALDW